MIPPTRIFQCRNGHLLCKTCKWADIECWNMRSFVWLNEQKLNIFNHQDQFEPLHLSWMQRRDNWKGNRHGSFLEVQQFDVIHKKCNVLIGILILSWQQGDNCAKTLTFFTGASSKGLWPECQNCLWWQKMLLLIIWNSFWIYTLTWEWCGVKRDSIEPLDHR